MIAVPFGPDGQTVSRLSPLGSPGSYKTYGAVSPLRTHWRPGTCEEADCGAWREGWVTSADLTTTEGQRIAHFITHDKTRRWTLQKVTATYVKFIFGPGQRCFTPHQVRSARPPRWLVRDGDFRTPQAPAREHKRPEFWVEDQQETIARVEAIRQRG